MPAITLDEDKLRELLCRAYESGWHGTKELKEETVDELMKSLPREPVLTINTGFVESVYQGHPQGTPMNLNMSLDSPIIISSENMPDRITIDPDAWRNVGDG